MKRKIRLLSFLSIALIIFSSCQKKTRVEHDKIKFSDGWTLHQADSLVNSGKIISTDHQRTDGWYKASVPSTVMGVLTANGLYDSLFIGDNYKKVDKSPFNHSWWYRKEFSSSRLNRTQHAFLLFNGLSYSANIWLNGKLIASKDSIYGTFRRFELDITSHLKEKNVLAVEVFKAQAGDPNIGFADWNPRPVDENMGLFRGVTLVITGKAEMKNTYVRTKVNTKTLDEAWLTIGTELQNLTDDKVSGELVGRFESVNFSYPIVLKPREKKVIQLTDKDVKELHIDNPRLWWCNNMGSPELYHFKLSFRMNNMVSDKDSIVFGIREVESYLTERGDRAFKLNGKDVLLKGAGWTDDIFLRDTPERNEIQAKYVKDMGLNLIRFENFWGNSSSIYDMCDKYGLLALVGWSCQWEWEAYYGKPCSDEYGCIQSGEEISLIGKSFEDQVYWLRNHPSIIGWMPGSDMLQKPELEKHYIDFLKREDNRPYIGAAKKRDSPITGKTGTKMAGPYEYVGPNYWYIDTLNGGAFGFNTETGIGAQLPIRESIEKFIPVDKLWPLNNVWNYHCTVSASAMNSLTELTKVIDAKYGKAKDLDDYLMKADLVNYDGTRAMFESFRVNLDKTTGIVQWMLNSAWPSLYWQLYDYYLQPTAAYYSVKKANQPIQLIYNYGNNTVYVVNEMMRDMTGLRAVIKIYDLKSSLLIDKELNIDTKQHSSSRVFELPPLKENIFLSLKLVDNNGKELADNFYCLSAKQDEYQWAKTDWIHTPAKSYADFKKLQLLPQIELGCEVSKEKKDDEVLYSVDLKNPADSVAFFVHLKIKDASGSLIEPAYWSDNYISLLPKENRKIKVSVEKKNVENKDIKIEIGGLNVTKIEKISQP